MKKLALLVGTLALGLGGMSAANADPLLCTDAGCAGVAADGWILVLDGAVGNPDPADGFVGITDGGAIDCDNEGGPYTAGTPLDAGCNP